MRPIDLAQNIFYYRCTKKKVFARSHTSKKMFSHNCKHCFKTVSFPLSEIEKMETRISQWEKESISESGSVAQNLKEAIRANQEKMDKLVSVYLDGDIERGHIFTKERFAHAKKASCSN